MIKRNETEKRRNIPVLFSLGFSLYCLKYKTFFRHLEPIHKNFDRIFPFG